MSAEVSLGVADVFATFSHAFGAPLQSGRIFSRRASGFSVAGGPRCSPVEFSAGDVKCLAGRGASPQSRLLADCAGSRRAAVGGQATRRWAAQRACDVPFWYSWLLTAPEGAAGLGAQPMLYRKLTARHGGTLGRAA